MKLERVAVGCWVVSTRWTVMYIKADLARQALLEAKKELTKWRAL